jgi:hypothetical protein
MADGDGGDDGMATVVAGLVAIGVCGGIGGADMDGLTTRSASWSRVAGAIDACGAGRLDRSRTPEFGDAGQRRPVRRAVGECRGGMTAVSAAPAGVLRKGPRRARRRHPG